MSEPELQLDPAIRIWVFLPIVLITFLIGIIRHYVSVLLSSPKKVADHRSRRGHSPLTSPRWI